MTSEKWGAGDKSKWRLCGKVKIHDKSCQLIFGEHKHGYSEERFYVVEDEESEPVPFSGHSTLISVQLDTYNYRKESHYSGDEIRKGGQGLIIADEEIVYEFFFRDIHLALLKANNIIGELQGHASNWLNKIDRANLVGTKVYYERTPCIISGLIVNQGCLILETADANPFPVPIYELEEDEEAVGEEMGKEIKTTVLDPKIWWFREILTNGR